MTEATQTAPAAAEAATGELSLLDQVLAETKMKPSDDGYDVAKRGMEAFLGQLLASQRTTERVDKVLVDAMIAEIDRKLSKQIDAILHTPAFQKVESSWRSLRFLVDRVDFRENVRVEILACSKDELLEDFQDAPEITKSGLYRQVYSNEYGTFGGEPYGMMVADFDFGPGPQDMDLLQSCAAVAAMSHAPFIANASPTFFGVESHTELPKLKDLESLFEGPQYARWDSFRDSEDARYVGLCGPRYLLRLPYGEKTVPTKSFRYEETVVGNHDAYLWGNSSFALASRVADSFAKFRWCPNIIGPQAGGAVENLPLHCFEAMGEIQSKIPTEVQLTERREFELAEQGFIGLVYRKDSDNAAFFSANSCQRPKLFGNTEEGKAAETNYRLGTQLPYMFIITRLAHYLKVLQREQIGTWKERTDLQRELQRWISQYVVDMENPAPEVRSRRPLRQAKVIVEDVPGQPGWYRCALQVRPHFKYMGASFTLSLMGRLDKQ
ncbi:MAG: type VI secretion system contractile sheath large subunit [Myxococcales bacterium]|nr:type VI secretion system contractile sheath large subunit [Myxococcales bacterium]